MNNQNQNRNGLKVGDMVRLKKNRAKNFPRPSSVINGFMNGDPMNLSNQAVHVDLDSRIDGNYIHPADHLEAVGVI